MHSLALKGDGTVWAWGDNYWGELGDGTTTSHAAPAQVKSLKGVDGIAARNCNSLALLRDGTVWTWGIVPPFASDAEAAPGPTPYQITGKFGNAFDSVVAVSAGTRHYLAVKGDGTVWAWGGNDSGQLGDGGSRDQYYYKYNPEQVQTMESAAAVAAGGHHSLALKRDGSVWAWGYNYEGQLGDGTTMKRLMPVRVQDLDSVTAIAAGNDHNLALKSDGTVWAWGSNDDGQLGDGTTTSRAVPVRLNGLANVVGIAAGSGHSLAVTSDGTVWAWGDNSLGQLGDGSTSDRPAPVQVQGLGAVTRIAAGDYHSLAITGDGAAWGWGSNGGGQLGNGSMTNRLAPVRVQGLGDRASETLLERFKGTILDFDASRVLWKQLEEYRDPVTNLIKQRHVLWLYGRADHSQTRVAAFNGVYELARAGLSAGGAVYADARKTYYWQDGAVRNSWNGQFYEANGNFALFKDSVVDLTTGESRSLPNANFNEDSVRRYDLSADGTVVYTSRSHPSNLYESHSEGTLSTYEPTAPDYTYYGAVTDGTNVLYGALVQKDGAAPEWSLRLRGADDRLTEIARNPYSPSDYAADPRASYRINNGWIAYKKYDEGTKRWSVYVRSPEGAVQQAYAAPQGSSSNDAQLSLKDLAPDGTAVYAYNGTTYLYSFRSGEVLYSFADPGELAYREHVVNGPGGEAYRLLAWYRLDGGLLYGVRP